MPGLEMVDSAHSCYRRSVHIDDQQGWVEVSHLPEQAQLLVKVSPNLAAHLLPVLARLREQFDLEANPTIIASHLQNDALLARQIAITPGLRVPGAFHPFELAIRAILGQQVSVAGATTISGRLVKAFGKPVQTPWPEISHEFPSAAVLANASVDQIAALGMPGKRASTVIAFARFAADGGLDFSANQNLETVVAQMKSLPGIGEWTAQYIAMRALRYPNAFPAGDLGLQKAAAIKPETRCSEKELLQRSQAWAPWRAYAALLLWQSL
jgi:AraC family transcriptional regulator of adaptative response / DNA-3-methyladenine glycosylase II